LSTFFQKILAQMAHNSLKKQLKFLARRTLPSGLLPAYLTLHGNHKKEMAGGQGGLGVPQWARGVLNRIALLITTGTVRPLFSFGQYPARLRSHRAQ
jgi:hypothetical protein